MRSRDYHYVITLQSQREGEHGSSVAQTVEGTVTAYRGDTRQDLYQEVYRRACEAMKVEAAVTVFCMLEPNGL